MARLEKKISDTWIKAMKPRETASDILERFIAAGEKDKKVKRKRNMYQIREFSKEASVDINGSTAISPHYTLDARNLATLSTKDVSQNYIHFCNQIETALGAPNLPIRIEIDGYPKLKSPEKIKERLAKYLRREVFELKILREICPEIEKTQNRATKAAITILTWLHNKGKNRNQGEVAKELYEAIFDREQDKLFYVRRHPKERMLHCCNDDAILERVSHLTWVFVNGNPFNKQPGVIGAISRLV